MRVSWEWLGDFVDLSGTTPEEVADGLTLRGLEVDEVCRTGAGLDGLVLARTQAVRPHPDADNLRLVTVAAGGAPIEVVCGARNVDAGQTVVFAPVGAGLPGLGRLKAAKIRGIRSEGMICSEAELGLPATVDGIWALPGDAAAPDAAPGADAVRALHLDDAVIVLELTPNRPDCLSMHGVAREVAAILGRPLRPLPAGLPWPGDADGAWPIEVRDPAGCPRYTAQVVLGVKAGLSPWRIRRRLHAVGLRAISNVVDVTNYILMEWGQPLHAFDLDRVRGGRIVVRRAAPGERLTTLDGADRALAAGDLVIADGAGPVALAGVMGGGGSEVGDGTAALLLESACFDPGTVRQTARRHGLHTESSHRFERGVDPGMAAAASGYAARLLVETAGGRLAARSADTLPAPPERRSVTVDVGRVNRLLGTALTGAQMVDLLGGIEVCAAVEGAGIRVTPPTRRPDIEREVDVAEEVARLHGFDRVEAVPPTGALAHHPAPRTLPTPPGLPPVASAALRSDDDRRRVAGVRRALAAAGFYEHVGLPLVRRDPADAAQVVLANPLGELGGLRRTLVPGLLDALHENARHGDADVRLFELGRVFTRRAGDLPVEEERLGLAMMGATPAGWNAPARELDFFDIKGVLQGVAQALGNAGDALALAPHPDPAAWMHPGAAATVRWAGSDADAGVVAEVLPDVRRAHGLPGRVFVAEVATGAIPQHNRLAKCYRGLSRFPSVERDVALVVSEATLAAEIDAAFRRARGDRAGRLIEAAWIFDVYRGPGVPDDRKSVALKVRYGSGERTLTGEEVERAHGRLVEALRAALGAEVRGS